MYDKHITGKIGEDIAEAYLRSEGYRILGRNVRVFKHGDVDILARKRRSLVLCEVKTRSGHPFADPLESIARYQKKRLLYAGRYCRQRWGKGKMHVRIDVIVVILRGWSAEIEHHENIFEYKDPVELD